MSPILVKICKDFATIWTTIDPIGKGDFTRIATMRESGDALEQRRGINLNPAPDLALQGEVWLAELCFEVAFLGQDNAEMQDDGERNDK